ncbi:hypothetical protein [Ramlibacter sp.]|uniref:hypothetical protein n=1 Tax=Ramlibacter sp. TaxID=1917967 RepID=UPI0018585659|nr:hypothetical protein [Ramlibacter sp.]MBA2674914.1 hypothetical protein [Ramlibacter sp.]
MAGLKDHHRHTGWSAVGLAWLATVAAGLWLSGTVLFGWRPDEALESGVALMAARHWIIVLHGALAWLACLLAGRWVWPHVPQVWRRRGLMRAWVLGIATLVTGLLIAFSGLALLYAPASVRDASWRVHAWVGIAWLPLVALHWRWRHR